MHILYRSIKKMTVSEKIENAKRRINELEALIQYWDKTKNIEKNNLIKDL